MRSVGTMHQSQGRAFLEESAMGARILSLRMTVSLLFGASLCAQFAFCRVATADEAAPPSEKLSLGMPLGHAMPVICIAFSANGKRIVTGSEDHTAIVWDAATGRQLGTLADPGEAA